MFLEKIKVWLNIFRLKTLSLSISGIVIASFIALSRGYFDVKIFVFASLTTILLQILSNISNDYGDGIKGTDKDRIGDKRAVASGEVSPKLMLKVIITFIILSFISGILLLWVAFGKEHIYLFILFIVIGISSIMSAILYTMGSKPYGYSGLGDVFVFIFFGLISVVGTYFLYTKEFDWQILLPATSVGLFSVGVLNLNNLRDYTTDLKSNKKTIVVKIGIGNAKLYHELLLLFAIISAILYSYINYYGIVQASFLIILIPLISHAKRVTNNDNPQKINSELKILTLITLSFSILFGLGLYLTNFPFFQFY